VSQFIQSHPAEFYLLETIPSGKILLMLSDIATLLFRGGGLCVFTSNGWCLPLNQNDKLELHPQVFQQKNLNPDASY
jgi:hypothetical protein